MLRISNIKLLADFDPSKEQELLALKIQKVLRVKKDKILSFSISKKSIDARDKNNVQLVYSVDVEINNESLYLGIKDVSYFEPLEYSIKKITKNNRPVVVGSGPAGLFCALVLAEHGLNPIVFEQGMDVDKRKVAVEKFWKYGELDTNCNVQFGEGGAGTFSDGKLTTGIKNPKIPKVFNELVEAGAPREISYLSKPHIGTDILITVVRNIRKKIERLGGEVRFETKMKELIIEAGEVRGLVLEGQQGKVESIETDAVVLAIGHSARDTFYMLKELGVDMIPKPFAVGVRIEHLQKDIDEQQFGRFASSPLLGASEYTLNAHLANGRGAYTFCMCPGGHVVAASSEKNTVVTNGMSYSARSGENANSALLVSVSPKDFNGDVLGAIEFQRKLERKAFEVGGGNYYAPVQLVGDFLADKPSKQIGRVIPTYTPGITTTDLRECLDDFIVDSIKDGLRAMDKKLSGFIKHDAILSAVESRSSSPVTIRRNPLTFESNIKGLYPCGEGAGYAGGITSSAVDGIKCAEALMKIDA
ncbi:FAD-binding protein [Anaerobacillus alkaliphilus]|uniref:FAD-binding protein n=1 Tax=Anaerobacillus alkaliphilus TaxID=1548597 RepID=A0A4Q0VWC4_9BACI|nr:FAD-binding protein [Anaerobacillus alkaliphilus]RXJ02451.1 FAD-binding protein [Anaerobacillus alkaliphilus]